MPGSTMSMPDLYHHLLSGDRVLLEAIDGLRWDPLTVVFVMLSAWWMKGVAFVAVGALGDVRSRRQLPVASLVAAVSVGIGSLVVALLKETVDRQRPAAALRRHIAGHRGRVVERPADEHELGAHADRDHRVEPAAHAVDRQRPAHADPGIDTVVGTPGSPSFPSGHTATAFAAAAVVGAFYPRLRWPLYGLAALVGISRIYLGVHFALDVVAGAILGLSIGLGIVWVVRKGRPRLMTRTGVRA